MDEAIDKELYARSAYYRDSVDKMAGMTPEQKQAAVLATLNHARLGVGAPPLTELVPYVPVATRIAEIRRRQQRSLPLGKRLRDAWTVLSGKRRL